MACFDKKNLLVADRRKRCQSGDSRLPWWKGGVVSQVSIIWVGTSFAGPGAEFIIGSWKVCFPGIWESMA